MLTVMTLREALYLIRADQKPLPKLLKLSPEAKAMLLNDPDIVKILELHPHDRIAGLEYRIDPDLAPGEWKLE